MTDYERLGVFYLGKSYDLAAARPLDHLLLYDSKDLCTHAVCVGMTGSGKTGLCLALLEEAAIDGIPAIIIDPKGDLGNLLLTFPQLRPEDFEPWIDPAEATRAGVTPHDYAAQTAERWKQGLADWDQFTDLRVDGAVHRHPREPEGHPEVEAVVGVRCRPRARAPRRRGGEPERRDDSSNGAVVAEGRRHLVAI
jgi:hypothetical protein